MILIGLVGKYELCESMIEALTSKEKTRANVLLNVSSYLLPPSSNLDPIARATRFALLFENLPRAKRLGVLFFGPLNSQTEANVLRSYGATIWHLDISATVAIDLDDLLVGDGFKNNNGFNPIEAVSETRRRHYEARAQLIPHPRDKQAGGGQ